MQTVMLEKLEEAREDLGFPVIINSGYRCEKHNSELGSTSQNHVKGLAADIRSTGDWTRYAMLSVFFKLGFQGIGIYPKSLHVDINHEVKTCWYGVYPKKKKK